MPVNPICSLDRGTVIDAFHLTKDPSVRIAKLGWHPLSDTSSHLVVLTSNGYLRMYNVLESLVEPELSVLVREESANSSAVVDDMCNAMRRISFGYFGDQPVAFAFGEFSETNCWSVLTVFVLFKSGDIYAISPFTPKTFRLSESSFAGLKISCIDAESSKFLESLSLKWTNQSASCTIGSSFATKRPKIIGPFLINPEPPSSPPSGDACDLLYISGKVDSLAVAYCSGRIDFLIMADPIAPQWKEGYQQILPFAVYFFETVRLSSTDASYLHRFYMDKISSLKFYCYHASGIHQLEIPWLLDMIASVDENQEPKDPKQTVVSSIVEFPIRNAITSLHIMFDFLQGTFVLYMTGVGKLKVQQLGFKSMLPSVDVISSGTQIDSPLKSSPFELFIHSKLASMPARPVCKDSSTVFDDKKTAELVKLSCDLRKEYIEQGNIIRREIESRLALLRKEVNFQADKLSNLAATLQSQQQKRMEISGKIRRHEQTIRALISSAEEHLAKAKTCKSIPTSTEEQEFFATVSRTSDIVNGLRARCQTVQHANDRRQHRQDL